MVVDGNLTRAAVGRGPRSGAVLCWPRRETGAPGRDPSSVEREDSAPLVGRRQMATGSLLCARQGAGQCLLFWSLSACGGQRGGLHTASCGLSLLAACQVLPEPGGGWGCLHARSHANGLGSGAQNTKAAGRLRGPGASVAESPSGLRG